MMLKFMLWMLFPAFSIQQCLTPDDSRVENQQNGKTDLYMGQQQFSLKLLEVVNSMTPTENIFFSPMSLYSALLLAYFISQNKTEESLKKTLGLPNEMDKLSTMKSYVLEKYVQQMRAYNGSSSFELLVPNRLFVSPKHKVRDCMKELFKDEITTVDFAKNAEEARKMINSWVEEQTKSHIKNLLNPRQVTEFTNLVLANAAYFKGVWKSRFQPDSTRKEIFYISNSQNAFVSMMRQKSTFNHMVSEKLGAHILELPYKGDQISMFIFLPPFASPNGIGNILKRMTLENFQEVVSQDNMIARPVELSMPKFSLEKELNARHVLQEMGVGDLFEPTADLSALTGEPGITLDDAVHKAKIKVDEEGTTAAAATAIFNFRSSRPLDPARFTCNHPFLYLLYDKQTKTVLFMGVYNKPDEKQ